MAMLAIDSSLELSLMTGLVRPSGIGNFLLDQTSSKKQARVTVKYESTSKFDALYLQLDQVKKNVNRDINEEITATHFAGDWIRHTSSCRLWHRFRRERKKYRWTVLGTSYWIWKEQTKLNLVELNSAFGNSKKPSVTLWFCRKLIMQEEWRWFKVMFVAEEDGTPDSSTGYLRDDWDVFIQFSE